MRKGRRKAVTVLGVAGALSLAGGASGAAVGPPRDTLTANTTVTLYEEEISDVSLSTFYVFDHENAGARRPGLRLAQRTHSRPRQGCGGCAVDERPHMLRNLRCHCSSFQANGWSGAQDRLAYEPYKTRADVRCG